MKKSKAWRYEQKKPKNDRDFLSYEELPLEDYEAQTPKVTKYAVKRLFKAFLILIVCALAVFVFANREKLTYDTITNWFQYELLGQGSGGGYPASIVGTKVSDGNFVNTDSYLAYASDTSFVTLSSNAYQISNRQLSYSKPVLRQNGNKIMVYNLGGTGFQINSVNENIYEGDAPDKILTCDIGQSGTYALVTQASGYLSKLYVYDNENKQKFTYSFADYTIYSAAVNQAGNGGVFCGISSKGGSASSALYILDFSSDKPKKVFEFDNNVICDIKYLSGDTIVAVGRTASYLIDVDTLKVTEKEYGQMLLTGYDINTDTGCFVVSLSRSGDGHSCDLLYFNWSGELVSTISTNYKITSVSLYKDRIAVLSGGTAHVYSKLGDKLFDADAGSDSRQIKLYNDNTAYILGITEIRQLTFAQPEVQDVS